MQSADGAVNVSDTYDSLNRLQTVVDSRLGTTSYQYDTANNHLDHDLPQPGPDHLHLRQAEPCDRRRRRGSSAYAYQRGPTGNLTSALESSNRNITWSFDGIYRLTGETVSPAPSHNNGSVSYSLDPVGNRLSDTSSLPDISSGSWGYNADDEVSSETYDSNGNVVATRREHLHIRFPEPSHVDDGNREVRGYCV